MRLKRIISGLFLFIEIAALTVLTSCLLIAEIWVAGKTDEYRYPDIGIMEPVRVKAGEAFSLPACNLDLNTSGEYAIGNPELISSADDGSFLCKGCGSSSIYLYIREKQITPKEPRYHNVILFGKDISAFLNLIYYQVRDCLDIELMKERTEIRTLRILQYPVICEELGDSRISRISVADVKVQDSLTLDILLEDLAFEISGYDESLIKVEPDESGKLRITALKEGNALLTVDYFMKISIYR